MVCACVCVHVCPFSSCGLSLWLWKVQVLPSDFEPIVLSPEKKSGPDRSRKQDLCKADHVLGVTLILMTYNLLYTLH
jgi:hypothetical protein